MDNENKIEFYQNRSFGERLSAAGNFLGQNWKVFYRNILIPIIPIVLLLAYLMPKFLFEYTQMTTLIMEGDESAINSVGSSMSFYMILSVCLSLYLYAMPAAIMKLYEEGNLTSKTSWSELGGKMFSNAGRLFLIGLAISLIMFAVAMIVYMIGAFFSSTVGVAAVFIIGLIVSIPPLALVIYPALFSGTSTWESIRRGFSIGFKNWGSTFGILLIVGIMGMVISYLLDAPYSLWALFNPDQINAVTYVFAILSTLGTVFVSPFIFVFLAFQYFSVAEKEATI